MSNDVAGLKTIPEIAKALGVAPHRVRYAIDSFDIKSTRRVGNAHVYSTEKVAEIERALRRIAGDVRSRYTTIERQEPWRQVL